MKLSKNNQIKSSNNLIFSIIIYLILSFFSLSFFLYFYIFQAADAFSYKRLFLSFFCGAFFTIIIIFLLLKKGLFASFKMNLTNLFFLPFLLSCYILLTFPLPNNHLFAKEISLSGKITNNDINDEISILWANNGIKDISLNTIEVSSGELIESFGLQLHCDSNNTATFSWKGIAWKELIFVIRSNLPFNITIIVNDEVYTSTHFPEQKEDFVFKIPISSNFIQFLAPTTVVFSVYFSISILFFFFTIMSMDNVKH